jgi:hypothetical protein
MTVIRLDEVRFHPHSVGDPAGRLFWWRGDLYRGVRASAAPFVGDLVERVLPRLVEKRFLPATTLTDFTLDGFEVVMRHEQVPFTAYPNEWCPAMLREASILYLDLVVELAGDGLGIKDMNPWNIVFDGVHPLFVDVMSIVPVEDSIRSFSEERFRRYYLGPLRLMEQGDSGLARALLPEYGGVSPETLARLGGGTHMSPFGRLGRRFRRPRSDHVALARSLRQEVEAVQIHAAPAQPGSGAAEEAAVEGMLAEAAPSSVLELRTSTAAAAFSAARGGARGIAFFDSDEHANEAFTVARAEDLWLLPLVLDFTKPTPAIGFFEHFSIAAVDRLRCELVVGGDAVRYGVVDRLLPFEHVAEALWAFSDSAALAWLPDRSSLPNYVLERASWYGEPAFTDVLRSRFSEVKSLSPDGTGSSFFLCRK